MKNANILDLEEKLRLAMLESDVAVLDELISDTLIFTAPTGDVINKQMDLDAHRSGIQKMTKLEPIEQHIQLNGNFAVVAVKVLLEGTFDGVPIDGTYCYTRVWADSQGHWQVVAGHVSRVQK